MIMRPESERDDDLSHKITHPQYAGYAGEGQINVRRVVGFGGNAVVIRFAGSRERKEFGIESVSTSGPEARMPVSDNPTRDEMNAKLEAVEARLDSKLAGIAADIKTMVSGQDRLREEVGEMRGDIKSYRSTVIIIGLTLGGLVVGFFAFGAQMLSLAAALFQAGPPQ